MHRICGCWGGTDLRCGLAGEAWTGNLITTHISGILIKSGGKTNERVVRRRRGWGWWEVVKIYSRKATHLSVILFCSFCFARPGTHLTAYATTFCQIIYNAFIFKPSLANTKTNPTVQDLVDGVGSQRLTDWSKGI